LIACAAAVFNLVPAFGLDETVCHSSVTPLAGSGSKLVRSNEAGEQAVKVVSLTTGVETSTTVNVKLAALL